jgi:hypothetical protein
MRHARFPSPSVAKLLLRCIRRWELFSESIYEVVRGIFIVPVILPERLSSVVFNVVPFTRFKFLFLIEMKVEISSELKSLEERNHTRKIYGSPSQRWGGEA